MENTFIHSKNISSNLMTQLLNTVENSFEKPLSNSYTTHNINAAIYTNNFSCVGLISKIDNYFYLDKLAVLKEYRGKGLGNALLNEIIALYSPLIWRSSHLNPFLNSFKNKAIFSYKTDKWIIYEYNKTNSIVDDELKKSIDIKCSDFVEI